MDQKKNPAGKSGAGDRLQTRHGLNSNHKSTAVEAQRDRIIRALRASPQSTIDLRHLGCFQSGARILELRRCGYDIRTELVHLTDADGYRHMNVARYVLEGEPGRAS